MSWVNMVVTSPVGVSSTTTPTTTPTPTPNTNTTLTSIHSFTIKKVISYLILNLHPKASSTTLLSSPFLNLTEELLFFSLWRWKVFNDRWSTRASVITLIVLYCARTMESSFKEISPWLPGLSGSQAGMWTRCSGRIQPGLLYFCWIFSSEYLLFWLFSVECNLWKKGISCRIDCFFY